MWKFFSYSDIDCKDYLACFVNGMTSEIPTLRDLIFSESNSLVNDEEHGLSSEKEAIQRMKTDKVFFSNSESQEKNL